MSILGHTPTPTASPHGVSRSKTASKLLANLIPGDQAHGSITLTPEDLARLDALSASLYDPEGSQPSPPRRHSSRAGSWVPSAPSSRRPGAGKLRDHCRPTAIARPYRHGSWLFEVPDGAYGQVDAWNGREAWTRDLLMFLASASAEACRARVRVDRDTLLRVASDDAKTADRRTGRGVATSHATVAKRLGMSPTTVRRCRRLLIELGFATEIVRGRHLTRQERTQARGLHGANQDRAASVRALTQPRPTKPVENDHPPRRGLVKTLPRLPRNLKNQHARARTGNTSIKTLKNSPQNHPPNRQRGIKVAWTPWPAHHFEFAKQLQDRMPALRHYHPATVCQLLAQSGIDPSRWTVQSLLHIMDLSSTARGGLKFASAKDMRQPLAYTAAVLRSSIDPSAETPSERQGRERAERRIQRDLQRASDGEERAGSASVGSIAAHELFFADHKHATPLPRPATSRAQLVRALIGQQPLYTFDQAAQIAVGDLTLLHKRLVDHGWLIEILGAQITATSLNGNQLQIDIKQGPGPALHYCITIPERTPRYGIIQIGANNTNDTVISNSVNNIVSAKKTNRVVSTNDTNRRIFINGHNDTKSVEKPNSDNCNNSSNDTVYSSGGSGT